MTRYRIVLSAVLFSTALLVAAAPVRADLPLVGDDEVPEKLTSVEEDGVHVFTRVALDEHHFDGFSLGGSDDLPAAEAERLRALVRDLGPNQWLFLQATADGTRWSARRRRELHRLDVTVALARTVWGLDNLERQRITTLPPRLAADRRGLTVFVATYEEQVIPFPEPAQPPPAPTPVIAAAPPPPRMDIGLLGGVGVMRTRGLTMATPTADLVFEKAEVRLDLGAGWWPAGSNELGDLANGSAKLTLSWFPGGRWIGPYVGWVSGSQFVREVGEYVLFSHGPTLGVLARAHHRLVDGALSIGYARVTADELGTAEQWANALVVSAQLGKVF